MKIGDRVFVRGYIDEIRKDTVIVRNDGGYFGTDPGEVITGDLPPAQPDLPIKEKCAYCPHCENCDVNDDLSITQPEPLTDKEQRIFLSAMSREEKVCKEVDDECCREPYEDTLVEICHEIIRKVKGVLWTT